MADQTVPVGPTEAHSIHGMQMLLALLVAGMIGAGLMLGGWLLFGQDEVTVPQVRANPAPTALVVTPEQVTAARNIDRPNEIKTSLVTDTPAAPRTEPKFKTPLGQRQP